MWVYTRDAWIPEAFPAREKSHNTRVNVHTTTRDNRYYGTVSARSEYTHTLSSLHDPILGGAGTHGHTSGTLGAHGHTEHTRTRIHEFGFARERNTIAPRSTSVL